MDELMRVVADDQALFYRDGDQKIAKQKEIGSNMDVVLLHAYPIYRRPIIEAPRAADVAVCSGIRQARQELNTGGRL